MKVHGCASIIPARPSQDNKCLDVARARGRVLTMNPLDTISGTIISGLVLTAVLVVVIKAIVGG